MYIVGVNTIEIKKKTFKEKHPNIIVWNNNKRYYNMVFLIVALNIMELSFHMESWKLYSLTISYYSCTKWSSVPLTKFNLTSFCQISHRKMVRNERNAHMHSYENKHDQGHTTKQRKHQKASRRYVRHSKFLDKLVRWKTLSPDVQMGSDIACQRMMHFVQ